MTAVTADAVPVPTRGGNPILRVARLQLVGWPYGVLWPWGILALSFLVNLAIYASVDDARGSWTGGLASIYVVQLVGFLQLFTRGFPFALAMSVTRRSYYLGTWLYSVLQAAAFGAVLLVLRLVEDATDGWGLSLHYFGLGFPRNDDLVLQYLGYVVPFLLMAALGACFGLVMERWRYNGLFTLTAVSLVLGGLAVIVVSRAGWWSAIGGWLTDQSATSLFAGWPLPFVVVLALLGYLVIRRATP
jgi:hypothetical protein